MLCLLLLALMLSCMSQLTMRKTEFSRFAQFFRHSEDYDVLFFGTSHVINGFAPIDLWDEYGIAAYNCGLGGSAMPTTYWSIVNSLDHSQPDLVILDCYRLNYPDKYFYKAGVQRMLDEYPLSLNKLRAAADLCWDSGSIAELIFPFVMYHSRWSELTENDFSPVLSETNGFSANPSVSVPVQMSRSDAKYPLTDDMPGVEYLKKIIWLCSDRGIELLLTYLPYPATQDEAEEANAIADIADEYGLDYINFLELDVIDLDTDMFDSFSHVNVSGARKITAYLGEYISEHFSLEDHRTDSSYQWMEDAAAAYKAYEVSLSEGANLLCDYLMLMRNNDWAAVITVNEGSPLYQDPVLMKLLENVSLAGIPCRLREAAETGEAYLLYVDNRNGQLLEYVGPDIPASFSAELGTVTAGMCQGVSCRILDAVTGEDLGLDRDFVFSSDTGFARVY